MVTIEVFDYITVLILLYASVIAWRRLLLHVSVFQTEMTAEEKRQEHQKELSEKLHREAKERLSGHKEKKDEKKCVQSLLTRLKSCRLNSVMGG